ncbi:MAG: helix-turn-helix transcriptional regulator, partial [Treponema sp.]|nr:helix-turn-helix transcriptional regulator [Treponema sp.]
EAAQSIYNDIYRDVLESISTRLKIPVPFLSKLLGDSDNYLKAIIPSNEPVAEQERRRQVGARIKEIRQHIGLTQAEVAEKLGIAKQSVTNYESGKTDPSIRNLIALATVLGVTTDYLLGRTLN